MITLPWAARKPAIGRWPLTMPLLQMGSKDAWTIRNSFSGLAIFGQTDSGKTSGSGRTVALKFLKSGFGGLICCAKKTEADLWRSYLKEVGRESDGRFFSAESDLRFNFINHESSTSNLDYVENLVNLLVDVASIKRSGDGGANQAFWRAEKLKLCRNAISLLLLAERPIEIRSLYDLIASSPRTLEQAKSADWRARSELYNLLKAASKFNGEHPELTLVDHYFTQERVQIHGGTRGTIEAEFTGTFDPLRRGKIGELFGASTNITPKDIMDGRVVVVDISTDIWREIGQLSNVIWTQMFQREVDRRTFIPGETRPVFLWQDEAQNFTVESDAVFASAARSKGCASVKITQGLPAYLDAYGKDGRHKVDALLGAHTTKFFHRNDCAETNTWASKLIAKDTVYRRSMSNSGAQGSMNTTISQMEEESCPAKTFLGLKNGGPENKRIVEAVIFESGRLFNGDRWLIGEFSQARSLKETEKKVLEQNHERGS